MKVIEVVLFLRFGMMKLESPRRVPHTSSVAREDICIFLVAAASENVWLVLFGCSSFRKCFVWFQCIISMLSSVVPNVRLHFVILFQLHGRGPWRVAMTSSTASIKSSRDVGRGIVVAYSSSSRRGRLGQGTRGVRWKSGP